MIIRKLAVVSLLSLFSFFVAPSPVNAAIKTLNNLSAMDQTFINDSNVQISSPPGGSIHNIIWNGLLPVSRGGTGANAFTAGSILFSNGTSISQANSNLFWDILNNRLGIGTSTPTSTLDVLGNALITGNLLLGVEGGTGTILGIPAATTDTAGGRVLIHSGNGLGSGNGGNLDFEAGGGGETGNGAHLNIDSGIGGQTSGNGGNISATAGDAPNVGRGGNVELQAGFGGETSGNGGEISLQSGDAVDSNGGDIVLIPGFAYGAGLNGNVKIRNVDSNKSAIFDVSSITTSDKNFTFPNVSGTFGLLEADQIWSGLNKFEAGTNSTIYVGSSVKSGCIALGDGNGVTYVTANDGVLTASSTKPSICQ